MKAIIVPKYGPPEVVQLIDVEKPAPTADRVLVKILAASINVSDLTFSGGLARLFMGLTRPKNSRLGADIAGVVEAVGSAVTQIKPGDEVFGVCPGGLAEYGSARQDRLVLKPANISFEQAAAVPVAATTALQGLRDFGHVRAKQKVLIYGASGGVGMFCVPIAKSFDAEVTAVCSTGNLDQARTMGADHVIDYTQEDFTRQDHRYDLVLAVNGYHPIWAYRRVLTPQGVFVMVGASHDHIFPAIFQAMFLGPLYSRRAGQKLGFMGIARMNQPDLLVLQALLASGQVVPSIDRRYPLSQAVDALRYLSEGHARGKVIITPEH